MKPEFPMPLVSGEQQIRLQKNSQPQMTQPSPIDTGKFARVSHACGAIQPHGALLVCETDAATITAASANAAEFFGMPANELLGKTLSEIVGGDGIHELRNALARIGSPPSAGLLLRFRLPGTQQLLDIAAHQRAGHLIVEFERAGENPNDSADALTTIQMFVQRTAVINDLEDFAVTAARLLRASLGYDRVAIERALPEGGYRILAQAPEDGARSEHVSEATGHPECVRTSDATTHLHMVSDTRLPPIPLLCADEHMGARVDLSHAHLRIDSSHADERMRSAGIEACLTIPLMIDTQLCGWIACYHHSPRRISLALRSAAEVVGRHVSLQIAIAERSGEQRIESECRDRLDSLARGLAAGPSMSEGLRTHLARLAALIDCDGAALWLNRQWSTVGAAPASLEIGPLLLMLERDRVRGVWQTSDLRNHHGLVASTSEVAGVLAIPLLTPRDFLLFFRTERARQSRAVAIGERTDRCAPPWTETDRCVAQTIKTYLRDLAFEHYAATP